jgi:alpha,alpha-trehalose phosphorylase
VPPASVSGVHQGSCARERTRASGATIPWRTIDGEEASAYFAPGTAQYHINADIAYALQKCVEVTGDDEFLRRYGAEILVETARLWCDLGFFSDRKDGRFCINGVTGPDEYTALVNNNTFTNLMARESALCRPHHLRSRADQP